MANFKGAAVACLQLVQHVQKPGELEHGVPLVPIGVGEMGENALRLQVGQGAQGLQLLRRPLGVVVQHPQTAHARVHLQVDAGPFSGGPGGAGQGLGQRRGEYPLGQLQIHHLGGQLRRGVPQDEDGGGDARPAQGRPLLQAGHRQIVRPQLHQAAGHRDGPVAIAVGLYRCQKPAVRGAGAQRPVIVFQTAQADLRPGPRGVTRCLPYHLGSSSPL